MAAKKSGQIRVGVGGWTFEPWRGVFYPEGLTQKRELEYASSQLTAIEINGTYYGSQKPASFVKWREETPEGFVFSVKGPRFTTNRRKLAEAGGSVERFFTSGVTELGAKLGPINWQFLPTKQYDAEDFGAFLELLPKAVDGISLRHVVELRHESFRLPEVVALLRSRNVAAVYTDKPGFPQVPDITADFVYVRLQAAQETVETGYPAQALDGWAERARLWAAGGYPSDLPLVGDAVPAGKPRDVFVYMINGFKPKAPAAAMALLQRLSCS
jgi:uncharacterized protein YecE (DUF72 family)